METRRLKLQTKLEEILGSDQVYFQPPTNIKMSYPAIVYKLDNNRMFYANDMVYNYLERYQITLMHLDPDNDTKDKLSHLPYCSMSRCFTSDNIYHYVYNIYC